MMLEGCQFFFCLIMGATKYTIDFYVTTKKQLKFHVHMTVQEKGRNNGRQRHCVPSKKSHMNEQPHISDIYSDSNYSDQHKRKDCQSFHPQQRKATKRFQEQHRAKERDMKWKFMISDSVSDDAVTVCGCPLPKWRSSGFTADFKPPSPRPQKKFDIDTTETHSDQSHTHTDESQMEEYIRHQDLSDVEEELSEASQTSDINDDFILPDTQHEDAVVSNPVPSSTLWRVWSWVVGS